MIHEYGSTMDQPWINVDQRGSAAFSVMARVSCVMRHASCVRRPRIESVQRPDSWLTCHASCVHAPRSTCPAGVLTHGSCVLTHGSCVMRPDSWLMRPTRPRPTRPRPTRPVFSCSIQSPPPVVSHDDNENGGNLFMR